MIPGIMEHETEPGEQKPKRPRRAYDIDELLHNALQRRAAKRTLEYHRYVSQSEALSEILSHELREEIAELSKEPPQTPKRKRRDSHP